MSIKDNGINKLFDKIEMPEDVKKNIYNNCSNHSRGLGRKYMLKKVAFAAVFLVTVTIGGVGVKAGFDSYKDRMKNMPKEEREHVEDIFNNSNEGGFYESSREFTRDESVRYEELCQEYASGRFPKESLRYIKKQIDLGIHSKANPEDSEYGKDELVFVEKDNFLHLPESEMTDEQMLQLIDFTEKLYTVSSEEIAKNIENETEEKTEEKTEEVTYNEKELAAIEKAREVIKDFCGADVSEKNGYEIDWLDQDDPVNENIYSICFDDYNGEGIYQDYFSQYVIDIDTITGKVDSIDRPYVIKEHKDYSKAEIEKYVDKGLKEARKVIKKYAIGKNEKQYRYEFCNEYSEESKKFDVICYWFELEDRVYTVKYNPYGGYVDSIYRQTYWREE